MHSKTLIVIGGGAAGFFCAINAARMRPGLKVIILEKTNKLLSKVKVSGGGRCNVTHACFDISEMSKKYPRGSHFVKKAFHQFFTTDTIKWFEERGVLLKTEEDGRMFPVSDSSQTIIDCIRGEADRYGVEILRNTEVKRLQMADDRWQIEISDRHPPSVNSHPATAIQHLTADFICIASGGYPKAPMFNWILKTGHIMEEPVPSLFTFNIPAHPVTALMGVSVDRARVKVTGSKLEESGPLLITHWGLSGPVILRLSAWGARELAACNWQFAIQVNWLPSLHEKELREKFQQLRFDLARQKISSKNPFGLPSRLWEFLAEQSGIDLQIRWADLPAQLQNKFIKNISACEFSIQGKTTFKEEFVTAGGVRLSEIDPQTMMSKKVPQLFFAGEVLDVDGITGGFNFQHAWTSGFVAAKGIAAL